MDKVEFDVIIAKRYVNKHNNAIMAGHEFSLTLSQFKKLFNRKYCAYTGREMHLVSDDPVKDPLYATVERIDSSKGYVNGNVVLVCQFINHIKGRFENPADEDSGTLQDIKRMVEYLAKSGQL